MVRHHPSASVRLVESLVLGRHEERGGDIAMRQRIESGSDLVLDHEILLGDDMFHSPGAHGDLKWVWSEYQSNPPHDYVPKSHVDVNRVDCTLQLEPRGLLTVRSGINTSDIGS